jgi:hypothetical protein
MFDFEVVHVFVIGVGVDEERCVELLGVIDGRTAAILFNVFIDGFA